MTTSVTTLLLLLHHVGGYTYNLLSDVIPCTIPRSLHHRVVSIYDAERQETGVAGHRTTYIPGYSSYATVRNTTRSYNIGEEEAAEEARPLGTLQVDDGSYLIVDCGEEGYKAFRCRGRNITVPGIEGALWQDTLQVKSCRSPGEAFQGRHVLMFHGKKENVGGAQSTCSDRHHGNLATIRDKRENNLAVKLMKIWNTANSKAMRTTGSFIGLTDNVREGHWQWINGDPVTYTNFAQFPQEHVCRDSGHLENGTVGHLENITAGNGDNTTCAPWKFVRVFSQPNNWPPGEAYTAMDLRTDHFHPYSEMEPGMWFDVGPPRATNKIIAPGNMLTFLCTRDTLTLGQGFPSPEQTCTVPRIADGLLSPPGAIPNGAGVTLVCDGGFDPYRDVITATCHDGVLDHLPRCVRIIYSSCISPLIPNGIVTPRKVRHGDTARVRCFRGFVGRGGGAVCVNGVFTSTFGCIPPGEEQVETGDVGTGGFTEGGPTLQQSAVSYFYSDFD